MLNVKNLCCRRGGRLVCRDINLMAEPGGCVIITGANGSGKSTFLRVLAGLIEPQSGLVEWGGQNILTDKASYRANLHYIGHLDALKTILSVEEMLDYWRSLRGIKQIDRQETLDAFALSALADRPIRTLSAGQKRRLSLTRLMLDRAPLWILDEPTTALDIQGQKLLQTQINRHREQGGTVILATHDEWNFSDTQRLVMAGIA